jgi:large subunit ribosomal protein L9
MGQVQLILQDDVRGLGEAGDVVKVKPGYARNYLLPQGKAMLATDQRINQLEHRRRVISEKVAKERGDLEALKLKIEGIALSFTAQAGEEGKLFGSITSAQIAAQLAEKGVEIDRRKLGLADPLKTIGEHAVSLRLGQGVSAEVKIEVVAAE